MENNVYQYAQDEKKNQGNLIGGIIGALLGALIGAVVWMIVGMLGYIASIVGFVIAFLADKGYDLLKGRQGVIKMIVLIVCVVLAVGAGTLGTYVWSIRDVYNEELAALTEVEKQYYEIMSEEEYMKEMLSDPAIQTEMFKDCGLGLVFGIMGSIGLISAAKKNKQQAKPAANREIGDEFAESTDQDAQA